MTLGTQYSLKTIQLPQTNQQRVWHVLCECVCALSALFCKTEKELLY